MKELQTKLEVIGKILALYTNLNEYKIENEEQ